MKEAVQSAKRCTRMATSQSPELNGFAGMPMFDISDG